MVNFENEQELLSEIDLLDRIIKLSERDRKLNKATKSNRASPELLEVMQEYVDKHKDDKKIFI